MKLVELKVARIGNSRGVRIPAATLERYRVGASVVMEERSDGILLRPPGLSDPKLSWQDTAREMATEGEHWDEWDVTAGDGMQEIRWEPERPHRVAERNADYKARRRTRKQ